MLKDDNDDHDYSMCSLSLVKYSRFVSQARRLKTSSLRTIRNLKLQYKCRSENNKKKREREIGGTWGYSLE